MLDYRTETFLTLCETMNYRIAAERLNLTQPAVTQHIRFLENEYGCRLFVYDRHRLSKTPQAELIERHLKAMQYNERELKEVLRGRPLTHLRIGATKTIGEFVLAEALAHYLSAEDRLLDFTVDNTRRLLEMLEDNRLDFALVEGYFNKAHYGCRLFREEPFVGICAPGHLFAGRAVALEETFGETLILREEGSGTRAIFEQLLRARSFSAGHFRRVVHISNFAMIQKLVAAGTGISFVYAAVAANSVPLATFTLTGMAVTSEFNYVFLKDTRAFEKIDLFERLSLISS